MTITLKLTYICLCTWVYVTVPWFSLSWGTEWFFILLWLTPRRFYWGCFKVKEFSQCDPRANSSKTSDRTKHPNPFQGVPCYQYHNKHSGLSHTGMPFLWKATFAPQHVITTDKGCRSLTEGVESSTPFCFSTVTTSTDRKSFLFPVTLKQQVTISQYLRPQTSREGEAVYIFLFVIFIMNIRPGTQQLTSVYIEMKRKANKGPASLDN